MIVQESEQAHENIQAIFLRFINANKCLYENCKNHCPWAHKKTFPGPGLEKVKNTCFLLKF